MKLCILDNDILEGQLGETYSSFGAMFIRLFRSVGVDWTMEVFNTQHGQYPDSFDDYDAVLLTGSRADSFSDEPWVVELRKRVTELLRQNKKMVGVCFGHQLIALCLGAPVGRAPQGWGAGRMTYDWHRPDLPHSADRTQIALLASHQDQVFELPPGATLVASSDFYGATTSVQFDDVHSRTIVTLANGLVETSTLDLAGELVSVVGSS